MAASVEYCQDHVGKEIAYLCPDCKKVGCIDCNREHGNTGHETYTIVEAKEYVHKDLKTKLEELQRLIKDKETAGLDDLLDAWTDIDLVCQKVKDEANKRVQQIREEEAKVLLEIEEKRQAFKETRNERDNYNFYLASAQSLEKRVLGILETKDPLELVSSYQQMEPRLKVSLNTSRDVLTKPPPPPPEINFKPAEEISLLGTVEQIGVSSPIPNDKSTTAATTAATVAATETNTSAKITPSSTTTATATTAVPKSTPAAAATTTSPSTTVGAAKKAGAATGAAAAAAVLMDQSDDAKTDQSTPRAVRKEAENLGKDFEAELKEIWKVSKKGKAVGELDFPVDVCFLEDEIVVAEGPNNGNRIQVFDTKGKSLGEYKHTTWSVTETREGYPAFSDIHNKCITVIDQKSGNILGQLGKGLFEMPAGLSQDIKGNWFIGDIARKRVLFLDPYGREILSLDDDGEVPFQWPMFVATDPVHKSRVFVSDKYSHCVKMFDVSSGELIDTLGSEDCAGNLPGQFNEPLGVAVDNRGRILVADQLNDRLCEFDANGEFVTSILTEHKHGVRCPRGVAVNHTGSQVAVTCCMGKPLEYHACQLFSLSEKPPLKLRPRPAATPRYQPPVAPSNPQQPPGYGYQGGYQQQNYHGYQQQQQQPNYHGYQQQQQQPLQPPIATGGYHGYQQAAGGYYQQPLANQQYGYQAQSQEQIRRRSDECNQQ